MNYTIFQPAEKIKELVISSSNRNYPVNAKVNRNRTFDEIHMQIISLLRYDNIVYDLHNMDFLPDT